MNHKFLIVIIVPTIQLQFNVYIPNNKKIGTIKKYVLEAINQLSGNCFQGNERNTMLIDRETGRDYENNIYVKDSGIKNGSKLIVMRY